MPYQVINNIPVWGQPLSDAVEQMQNCQSRAYKCALMADHHIGYAVPIGGVVAYRDRISPSGVGFDIACGNKAVRLDAHAQDIRRDIKTIMDDIFSTLSFGVGMQNEERVEHPLFKEPGWEMPVMKEGKLKKLAQEQLGTVGSGNHYVDIFTDEEDRVWVGVHFGSRGLGHRLATYFIRAGGGRDGMHVDPVVLDARSDLAQDYIACMKLAGRYAYAGRDWVCQRVARIIGANILEEVHNHHNFAWEETHNGEKLWVVRKGATPAFPGQRGFIGGSMGEPAVIVEGVDSDENRRGLYSTVHGAGRVLSRTAAAGRRRGRGRTGGQVGEAREQQADGIGSHSALL